MSFGNTTFTLILPTLNEREGLEVILPLIDRSLFNEVVVVDGGSTDGTPEFVELHGLRLLRQPETGLPDALRHAFLNTTGDVLVIFTPDGNSLSELLPNLCAKMQEGYDLVVVSRYLGHAQSLDDDFLTAFGNRMFTWIINLLFGTQFTDSLVGYRAIRRSAIETMGQHNLQDENFIRRRFFHTNGWEASSCMRAARLGLKTTEIPGDEPERIGSVRKLSIIKHGLGLVYHIAHDFIFFRPRTVSKNKASTVKDNGPSARADLEPDPSTSNRK